LYQLAHAVEVLRFVDEPGTRMSVNTGANPIKLFTVVIYGFFVISTSPALPINIRLYWKGLPGTNTLAYYENL
jgi:hypothetical protein